MRKRFGVIAVAAFCLSAIFSMPAHAQVWSSCSQYATYTSGQYNVYTDEWGASSGQCLYVYSATNWTSASNFSGNGIKAYPDTEFGLNNVQLSSLSSVPTSFNVTVPSGASYDVAYDLWTANNVDEVMVWEEWNNNGPLSNSYGCSGYPSTACPIATNVYLNGAYYNVFQGNNGHNVISFLRNSQRASGNEDVLPFMNWCASNGKLNSQQFSTADFGIEITATSGTQNFTLNSYSSSIVTNGGTGGGTGLAGTHTLKPQNASNMCLDASNWGGAGTAMQIWSCTGGTNQSYYCVNQYSNIYEIEPTYDSALCLDVWGNRTSNGTEVDIWTCNGQSNQKWGAISDGGNVYELAPQNATGLRLDVYGFGTTNGTKVDVWSANGGSNQKWAVN
ncbi:MAG: RICIN domain-containing protein [Acidobacteriota bacterium]